MEKIQSIPMANYVGYLCYSDDTPVRVLNHEKFSLEASAEQIPFIIEGELYDEAQRLSWSIRYADGQYRILRYEVLEEGMEFDHQYVVPRFDLAADESKETCRLHFYQYWMARPEPLCEGMEVLMPAQRVFVGFEQKAPQRVVYK